MHLFRGDYAAFDGKAENRGPPPPLMPNDVIQWGRESEQFVDQGGNQRDRANPAKRHGLKRVSALFQLPYWRVRTPKLSLVNYVTCINRLILHCLHLFWHVRIVLIYVRITSNYVILFG